MKTMNAKFKMSLWNRIRAASLLWWDIVVLKGLKCVDDETIEEVSDKLGAWLSAALEDDNVCEEMKVDIRNWFKVME